jgi:hypothetical protein
VLPQDGKPPPGPSDQGGGGDGPGEDAPKEAVLVLDADVAPMAEQVLLQLILLRAKAKALVGDAAAGRKGFGPYVDVVGGSAGDGALLRRALRGVRALVLCGRLAPGVLEAAAAAGVPHLVLLSAVGAPPRGGFALFGGGEMTALQDAGREAAVARSGIPFTIVRVAALTDAPGGASELRLEGGAAAAPSGEVSREDAAAVVARAAGRDASGGRSVTCSLRGAGPGAPPQDWDALFAGLREKAAMP